MTIHLEQPIPTRPNLWIAGDRIQCMRCKTTIRINLHPRFLQDAFEAFADAHARCKFEQQQTQARQDVAAPYEGGEDE